MFRALAWVLVCLAAAYFVAVPAIVPQHTLQQTELPIISDPSYPIRSQGAPSAIPALSASTSTLGAASAVAVTMRTGGPVILEWPSSVTVGTTITIRGTVPDPDNAQFGLPSMTVNIEIARSICRPDRVDTFSVVTSMSGTWSVAYTPTVAGPYTVKASVQGMSEIATASFTATTE